MLSSTILKTRVARYRNQESLLSNWAYKDQEIICDECKKRSLDCGFHAVDTTYDLCSDCYSKYVLASQLVSVRQWVEFEENITTKVKVAKAIDQELLLVAWPGTNSEIWSVLLPLHPLQSTLFNLT